MDQQPIEQPPSEEEIVASKVTRLKKTMSQMKKKKGKVWNQYQKQLDFYTLTEKEYDAKYE